VYIGTQQLLCYSRRQLFPAFWQLPARGAEQLHTSFPFKKSNKPASSINSYRPVSLTSCVAIVTERAVSRRLMLIAENRPTSMDSAMTKLAACALPKIKHGAIT